MFKLSHQYRIINKCLFVYNNSIFSDVSDDLRREQKVLNLKDVLRDIYHMEVEVENGARKLSITVTLTPKI